MRSIESPISGETTFETFDEWSPDRIAHESVNEKISNRRPAERLLFVDSARGFAMLFVFVSHFAYVYFDGGRTREILAAIGMVASPMFVLISGFMLGFLYRIRGRRFAASRTRVIDRGIFMVTLGHALILLAHTGLEASWRWGFITDAIGISMIAGALLVDRVSPSRRLVMSLLLYVSAWVGVFVWRPNSAEALLFQDAFLGTSGGHSALLYSFPVVPWFSLYFAASVLGERFGDHHVAGSELGRQRMLARLGLGGAVFACLGTTASVILILRYPELSGVKLHHHKLTVTGIVEEGSEVAELLGEQAAEPNALVRLSSPFQKLPPGPVYFALYGGIGALVLFACSVLERRRKCIELLSLAAAVGRVSLFVFILQYFGYYVILKTMGPGFLLLWPAYFVSSASLLVLGGLAWDQINGNRFITVGYPRLDSNIRRWRLRIIGKDLTASCD